MGIRPPPRPRASGMACDPSSASPASPPAVLAPASPPNPAGRPVAASPIRSNARRRRIPSACTRRRRSRWVSRNPHVRTPVRLARRPRWENHDRTGTPRVSVDAPSLVGRVFGSPTRPRVPAFEPPIPETDGPWYIIEDAVPWHGPAVPSRGPDEHEEPFMVTSPKTPLGPHHLLPWEGVEWVGPQVLKIIETGLKDYAVNPAAGRPDTRNASPAVQMYHMRRAVADVLPTPLFSFLLRVFEGPDTDPAGRVRSIPRAPAERMRPRGVQYHHGSDAESVRRRFRIRNRRAPRCSFASFGSIPPSGFRSSTGSCTPRWTTSPSASGSSRRSRRASSAGSSCARPNLTPRRSWFG